jgi:hypothetical protein
MRTSGPSITINTPLSLRLFGHRRMTDSEDNDKPRPEGVIYIVISAARIILNGNI